MCLLWILVTLVLLLNEAPRRNTGKTIVGHLLGLITDTMTLLLVCLVYDENVCETVRYAKNINKE